MNMESQLFKFDIRELWGIHTGIVWGFQFDWHAEKCRNFIWFGSVSHCTLLKRTKVPGQHRTVTTAARLEEERRRKIRPLIGQDQKLPLFGSVDLCLFAVSL